MIELLLEAERALSVGMLDQAERLYRQAAEGDRRNAIAIVGLARVALERGDEPAALALGERALTVDPDNVAARRLVDRLVEVRAHRGIGDQVGPAPSATEPAGQAPTDTAPAPPAPEAGTPRRGLLRRIIGRR